MPIDPNSGNSFGSPAAKKKKKQNIPAPKMGGTNQYAPNRAVAPAALKGTPNNVVVAPDLGALPPEQALPPIGTAPVLTPAQRVQAIIQGYQLATWHIPSATKISTLMRVGNGTETAQDWADKFHSILNSPGISDAERNQFYADDIPYRGTLNNPLDPNSLEHQFAAKTQRDILASATKGQNDLQNTLYGSAPTQSHQQQLQQANGFFDVVGGVKDLVHAITIPVYADQQQKDAADASLANWPSLRPLVQLQRITTAATAAGREDRSNTQMFLTSRGYTGKIATPPGAPQYPGPLSPKANPDHQFTQALKQYTFDANVVAAASGDAKAAMQCVQTGLISDANPKSPTDAVNVVKEFLVNSNPDEERRNEDLFARAFDARNPSMPAGSFVNWYDHHYHDLMPKSQLPALAQFTKQKEGGMLAWLTDDVSRVNTAIGHQTVDRLPDVLRHPLDSAVSDVNGAASVVLGYAGKGVKEYIKKMDPTLPSQIHTATAAVNYAVSAPERFVAANAHVAVDLYRAAEGKEGAPGFHKMVADAAREMTRSDTTPGSEMVASMGLDPNRFSWVGGLTDNVAYMAGGSVMDAAVKAAGAGLINTELAARIGTSVGVDSDAAYAAAITSSAQMRSMFPAMSVENAEKFAGPEFSEVIPGEAKTSAHSVVQDEVPTEGEVTSPFQTHAQATDKLLADPTFRATVANKGWRGPSAPSFANSWKFHAMNDPAAPLYDRLLNFSTMDNEPWDLTHTGHADQKMIQYALRRGIPHAQAVEYGNRMVRAMANDAGLAPSITRELDAGSEELSPGEVRARLSGSSTEEFHRIHGEIDAIDDGFVASDDYKALNKEDPNAYPAANPGHPTRLDEIKHFQEALHSHYSDRFDDGRNYGVNVTVPKKSELEARFKKVVAADKRLYRAKKALDEHISGTETNPGVIVTHDPEPPTEPTVPTQPGPFKPYRNSDGEVVPHQLTGEHVQNSSGKSSVLVYHDGNFIHPSEKDDTFMGNHLQTHDRAGISIPQEGSSLNAPNPDAIDIRINKLRGHKIVNLIQDAQNTIIPDATVKKIITKMYDAGIIKDGDSLANDGWIGGESDASRYSTPVEEMVTSRSVPGQTLSSVRDVDYQQWLRERAARAEQKEKIRPKPIEAVKGNPDVFKGYYNDSKTASTTDLSSQAANAALRANPGEDTFAAAKKATLKELDLKLAVASKSQSATSIAKARELSQKIADVKATELPDWMTKEAQARQAEFDAAHAELQAEKDAATAQRNAAVVRLHGAEGVEKVPVVRGQFEHVASPEINEMTAALFNQGPIMRAATLAQERVGWIHWNNVNNFMKRTALFRVGTQIGMNTADEGLMAVLMGVVPGWNYKKALTADEIATIETAGPEFQSAIGQMNGLQPHQQWSEAKPGSSIHPKWSKEFLKKFNATSEPVVRDWITTYNDTMDKLIAERGDGKRTVTMHNDATIAANDQMRIKAKGTIKVKKGVKTGVEPDPYYHSLLMENHVIPSDKYIAKMSDRTNAWLQAMGDRMSQMAKNAKARKFLELGPDDPVLDPKDLEDPKVQAAIGEVPATRQRFVGTGNNNPVTYLLDTASSKMFHVSNIMSEGTKTHTFWKYFGDELKYLKKEFGDTVSEDDIKQIARSRAIEKVKAVSYFNNRTLLEENLHNAVWFLPSYRQFFSRWIPFTGKHFFQMVGTARAAKSLSKITLPNGLPVIGGQTAFDVAGAGSFFRQLFEPGLSPGQRIRQTLPPIAGTISDIAEMGALLGNVVGRGGPETFYEKLTGGYAAGQGVGGLPGLGQVAGPLDSLIYGVSAGLGHPIPYTGVLGLGPMTPAQAQTAHTRLALQTYNMVDQALASNGRSVDWKKAQSRVGWQTAIVKGAIKEVSPLRTSQILPTKTYTITPYTVRKNKDGTYTTVKGNPKKVTINLQNMRDAAWEVMNAATTDVPALLKKYPEYALVQKAWLLSGDDRQAFLSQHPEIISFVTRRTVKNAQSAGQVIMTEVERLQGRSDMAPVDIQNSIQQGYRDNAKWLLSQKYQAAEAATTKTFNASMKKKYGAGWAKDPRYLQVEKNNVLPGVIKSMQDKFEKQNHADIAFALGNGADPFVSNDKYLSVAAGLTKAIQTAGWVNRIGVPTSGDLKTPQYTQMAVAYMYGTDATRAELRTSPLWGDFLGRYHQEQKDNVDKAVEFAVKSYKTELTPDQRKMVGMPAVMGPKETKAVSDYLGLVDTYHNKLAKLTFGTKEWIAQYGAEKQGLADYRATHTDVPSLRLDTGNLLSNIGLDKQRDFEGYTAEEKAVAAFWAKQKIHVTVNNNGISMVGGMSLKDIRAKGDKLTGKAATQWKEDLRVFFWRGIILVGQTARTMLQKEYGDKAYKNVQGKSIESKIGQQVLANYRDWVGQIIKIDAAAGGGTLEEEWKRLNKKHDIAKDLIDPSRF